jgi:hypothetical protein
MAQIVWERYEPDQEPVYLQFLSFIINSVDNASPATQYVSERHRVERLFALAVGGGDHRTSDDAMDVLYELCSHCGIRGRSGSIRSRKDPRNRAHRGRSRRAGIRRNVGAEDSGRAVWAEFAGTSPISAPRRDGGTV